ncbi:MAG: hypothetical protein DRJ66_04965 [Thermoprotei archaeon]|nr:MAG: hypothetical protein DRJ66_04965 [Thermoprotei archaeon]RLF19785.1 MAG: hypothetical protein DRZ82_04585 [Thermoprotei archaeon]
MRSRELVYRLFEEGLAPRVPLHIESDNKDEEFYLGDIVGIGAKIKPWRRFYVDGGPFRRREKRFHEWIEGIDLSAYEWPEISNILEEAVNTFVEKAQKYKDVKFIMFKVLGPTETAESFFAPPTRSSSQIFHMFGFAILVRFRPKVAYELYDRISRYILELIKAGTEIDFVDAIRIADDVADYRGLLYPRSFVTEKYLYWHKLFANAIRKGGKIPIIHCDGNLVKASVFKELTEIYRGIHPLDFRPKSTLHDALLWIDQIVESRNMCREGTVFFTGIPIDLVFNDSVTSDDLGKIITTFLERHGPRNVVLATTHSPYPGRSYKEPLAKAKIRTIQKIISFI